MGPLMARVANDYDVQIELDYRESGNGFCGRVLTRPGSYEDEEEEFVPSDLEDEDEVLDQEEIPMPQDALCRCPG